MMTSAIKSSCKKLCSYTNTTAQPQVIRIVNIPNWFFEQVISPRQRLLFNAPSEAEVEVYSSHLGQSLLVKKISGASLRIEQS
jgi:hypothetical protein